MKCELCGSTSSDMIVILPIHKQDGSLITLTCLKCAQKSDAYCNQHEAPHLGFEDGSSACKQCIDELVVSLIPQGDIIFGKLVRGLPSNEINRIIIWVNETSFLGDSYVLRTLIALSSKSLRSGQEVDEIIDVVIRQKSVDAILSSTR